MNIGKGAKMILAKPNNKSKIEISRHKDPIMDNILLINSLSGSKTYKNTWITEKDLPSWLEYLKNNGYTDTKIIEDVESLEKNNKKKS